MANHDGGYHALFSHPEMVVDLFQHCITEPWVKELDFTTLERINAKLHADNLEQRDGDVIYSVKYRDGRWACLYLFLEFQSKPDKWMPVRMLVYTGLLLQHLIKQNRLGPTGLLPAVFPLVLYNGDSAWGQPTQLCDLIDLPDDSPLWPWQPQMRYYIFEERLYPKSATDHLTGLLFELENSGGEAALTDTVQRLARLLSQGHHQAGLQRAFMTWIEAVLLPHKGLALDSNTANALTEVSDMLSNRLAQWRDEYIAEGYQKGIDQGYLGGELAVLIKLLDKRFGPLPEWALQKVETADSDTLSQWALNVLDAPDLHSVFN